MPAPRPAVCRIFCNGAGGAEPRRMSLWIRHLDTRYCTVSVYPPSHARWKGLDGRRKRGYTYYGWLVQPTVCMPAGGDGQWNRWLRRRGSLEHPGQWPGEQWPGLSRWEPPGAALSRPELPRAA